jgi:hypothetical protein
MAPLCIVGFCHDYDVLPRQRAKIPLALVLELDRGSDLAKSVMGETPMRGQPYLLIWGIGIVRRYSLSVDAMRMAFEENSQ